MLPALVQAQSSEYAFRNPNLPIEKRVEDLLSRLTLEEKVSQMMDKSPAIARLGIPEYQWWNEALHGVARAGLATVFLKPLPCLPVLMMQPCSKLLA